MGKSTYRETDYNDIVIETTANGEVSLMQRDGDGRPTFIFLTAMNADQFVSCFVGAVGDTEAERLALRGGGRG